MGSPIPCRPATRNILLNGLRNQGPRAALAQTTSMMAISGIQIDGAAEARRTPPTRPFTGSIRRKLDYHNFLDRNTARKEALSEGVETVRESAEKPDIFRYESHRDFLRDQFLWQQARNPNFRIASWPGRRASPTRGSLTTSFRDAIRSTPSAWSVMVGPCRWARTNWNSCNA